MKRKRSGTIVVVPWINERCARREMSPSNSRQPRVRGPSLKREKHLHRKCFLWWNDSNVKRILFNALFEFAVWKIRTTIKLPIFPIAQHKFSTTSWANSLLYLLLYFINIFYMLIFCYGRIVF